MKADVMYFHYNSMNEEERIRFHDLLNGEDLGNEEGYFFALISFAAIGVLGVLSALAYFVWSLI